MALQFKQRILSFTKEYSHLFFLPICFMIVIRVFEYTMMLPDTMDLSKPLLRGFSYSIEYDLIFIAVAYLVLFPLFLGIWSLSKKAHTIVFYSLFTCFLVLHLALNHFFWTGRTLLDKVIFFFSFDELVHVVSTESSSFSGGYFWVYLLVSVGLLVAIFFYQRLIQEKRYFRYVTYLFCLLSIGLFIGRGTMSPVKKKFKNQFEVHLYSSKPTYFFKSIYRYSMTSHVSDITYEEALERFKAAFHSEDVDFIEGYPFLYKTSEFHVIEWEEYMDIDSNPNIVMIFAEGLSSSFLGKDSHFGNMMPFLDSLAGESLYWPNMLSNTDRTHGVFSSALAGLPHGFERGFLNFEDGNYPEHLSVSSLLKNKGYQNSFFYGGWSGFDHYDVFLWQNGFEHFFDKHAIRDSLRFSHIPINTTGNGWGYHDHDLMEVYFDVLDSRSTTPYFDVVLTLDLHPPYRIPGQERFSEKIDSLDIRLHDIEASKDVVSTVLYTDDFFRKFFEHYSKLPEYENTVFMIMGDHNLQNLGFKNDLDMYHVPFILYSPNLKQAQQFETIVSHWDVAPTLYSLMRNMGGKINNTHWLGKGVRFENELSAPTPIFTGNFKGEINGVVYRDKYYRDGRLYGIKPGLHLDEITDAPDVLNEYEQLLQSYIFLNNFVMTQDVIYNRVVK